MSLDLELEAWLAAASGRLLRSWEQWLSLLACNRFSVSVKFGVGSHGLVNVFEAVRGMY